MKYIFALVGLFAYVNVYATPTTKPTYDIGLSASYEPSVLSNNSVIRTSGSVSKNFGKFQLSSGLEIDYSSQSPINSAD